MAKNEIVLGINIDYSLFGDGSYYYEADKFKGIDSDICAQSEAHDIAGEWVRLNHKAKWYDTPERLLAFLREWIYNHFDHDKEWQVWVELVEIRES